MSETYISILQSPFSQKVTTPIKKIWDQLIGEDFPAKRTSDGFRISTREVVKRLEEKNPRSPEADWIRERLKDDSDWVVKNKQAKEKA